MLWFGLYCLRTLKMSSKETLAFLPLPGHLEKEGSLFIAMLKPSDLSHELTEEFNVCFQSEIRAILAANKWFLIYFLGWWRWSVCCKFSSIPITRGDGLLKKQNQGRFCGEGELNGGVVLKPVKRRAVILILLTVGSKKWWSPGVPADFSPFLKISERETTFKIYILWMGQGMGNSFVSNWNWFRFSNWVRISKLEIRRDTRNILGTKESKWTLTAIGFHPALSQVQTKLWVLFPSQKFCLFSLTQGVCSILITFPMG